jgi:HEAT repeat protein
MLITKKIPEFLEALQSPIPEVVNAARQMAEITDPEAIVLLLPALDHANSTVRCYAALALASIAVALSEANLANDQPSKQRTRQVYLSRMITPLIALLHDKDVRLRATAASALGYCGGSRATTALIELLNISMFLDGGSRDVIEAASTSLVRLGEKALPAVVSAIEKSHRYYVPQLLTIVGKIAIKPQVINPILDALKDSDEQTRATAIMTLGTLRDTRAVESLLPLLDDPRMDIRRKAIRALGSIGDERAVEPLLPFLEHEDADIRYSTAYALRQLADIRTVLPFIRALTDSYVMVRKISVFALQSLADLRAVEPLIRILDDPNDEVAGFAAIALGELKDMRAFAPLVAKYERPDTNIKREAAAALGHFGEPALPHLLAGMKSAHEHVRKWTAIALGILSDTRAGDALVAALTDEDEDVRADAARALGQFWYPPSLDPLINMLAHEDDQVFRAVEHTLITHGAAALEALIYAASLEDSPIPLRAAAIRILGRLGDERAHKVVVNAFESPNPDIRIAAVEALVNKWFFDELELLINGLQDDSAMVRHRIVGVLSARADAGFLDLFVAALRDSDANVRTHAALALGRLRDGRGVPPLITALVDDSPLVKRAVIRALQEIGTSEARVALREENGKRGA